MVKDFFQTGLRLSDCASGPPERALPEPVIG